MLASNRTFSDVKPAVYIQNLLRRVGVRMEISNMDFGLLHRRYRAGDFDAVIHIYNNFPGLTMSYSSIGYGNPRIFQLHDSAERTMDPESLDGIYREIMAIHSEDLPMVFLYPVIESFIVRNWIRGLSTPHHASAVMNLEHLWIEEKR